MLRIVGLVVAALLPLVFLIGIVAQGGGADDYSFSLNGKPIEPHAEALRDLGIDADGVLVHLPDLVLLIDKPGHHAFTSDLDKDGKLYDLTDGKKQLIGLRTQMSYEGSARVQVNPFAGLTPEDMKQIRGIYLDDAVSGEVLTLLKHAALQNVFFVLTDEVAHGDERVFPPIPDTVEYLRIDERSSEGIEDYAHLQSFRSLRYLELHALMGPKSISLWPVETANSRISI